MIEKNILIVDDDDRMISLISRMIKNEYHTISFAKNGIEAFDLIVSTYNEQKYFDLMIVDMWMPKLNGLDLLKKLKNNNFWIPSIAVTGDGDKELVIELMQSGCSTYLDKPFTTEQLLNKIKEVFKSQDLKKEAYRMAEKALQESYKKLNKTFDDIVKGFSSLAEKRDPYTAGHQTKVSLLACAIAKRLDYSSHKIKGLKIASILHDIGKIHIPAEILNKPGTLSRIEMDLIRTHSEAGYDILKEIDFPWPIADIVLLHHERIDGSGYPRGLTEKDIPEESKIISVSDIVEAISSHRPYRAALGFDVAIEVISSERGKTLDSKIVDACIELFNEGFQF